MNRKQRREKLQKIAEQQQAVDAIIQREVDAMEASDVNDADGGESPKAYADRITLEIMNSLPMPGIDDPL